MPPDWEARRDGTGRQVYYDHERKVVRLDKPDQETGQSSRALHCRYVYCSGVGMGGAPGAGSPPPPIFLG